MISMLCRFTIAMSILTALLNLPNALDIAHAGPHKTGGVLIICGEGLIPSYPGSDPKFSAVTLSTSEAFAEALRSKLEKIGIAAELHVNRDKSIKAKEYVGKLLARNRRDALIQVVFGHKKDASENTLYLDVSYMELSYSSDQGKRSVQTKKGPQKKYILTDNGVDKKIPISHYAEEFFKTLQEAGYPSQAISTQSEPKIPNYQTKGNFESTSNFAATAGRTSSQTSFAIFPIERRDNIKSETVEEAQVWLNQRLLESKKYVIVDRQRTSTILREQAFQLTGATDQASIIKLGKIFNVEKFVRTILYQKRGSQLALICSVIDVTTGQTEMAKELTRENYPPASLASDCAGEIISAYPLIGKIQGAVKDVLIFNLGSKQGLAKGDRLFVARKKAVTADDGKVLFQELVRIGTIEVTAADDMWSKAKIMQLDNSESSILKDDLISPSPIPKKEPVVSNVPLLATVKKGKLLLEDDMKKRQYLSVMNYDGDSYKRGKLNLITPLGASSLAQAFYPPPFDQLRNFILEGEMEFTKQIERGKNCFKLYFRANNKKGKQFRGYAFLFDGSGRYGVSIQEIAKEDYIIPFTSSPLLSRGEGVNKFKIVAYDSKFDLYINDKYLASFEDEMGIQGGIGLMVRQGTSATVSNILVWEAEKQ